MRLDAISNECLCQAEKFDPSTPPFDREQSSAGYRMRFFLWGTLGARLSTSGVLVIRAATPPTLSPSRCLKSLAVLLLPGGLCILALQARPA